MQDEDPSRHGRLPAPAVVAPCDELDQFPDPVISIDATGRIIRWNAAATQLLGRVPDETLGRPIAQILTFAQRDASGRFPERQWVAVEAGRRVPVEVTQWTTGDPDALISHLCLRNASSRVAEEVEQEQATHTLRRQARSDPVTGLANRYELEDKLNAALAEAGAAGRVAVVVIDLDGFKPINDTYGHAVGDEVLSAVGHRIAATVRHEDTVARVGGDEFVVLSMLKDGMLPASVTHRMRAALDEPISTSAGTLTIGASLGIAVAEPESDAADLMRRADKAMYRVKMARSSS